MTKKIVSTSVALSAILIFIGCGSSNDTASTPTATGTAYYIDSAVSGVNYTCGSTEGITGADGSFTFEVGGSCTFYLGDVALRSVDAGLLEDGKNVYETDVKIARILQSLDTDGNPDNGITLDADIIAALSDAGISSLPETEEEMDVMLEVIEVNGGIVVTEDDAQAHLDVTMEEAIASGDIPAPVIEPTPTPAPTPTVTPTVTPTLTLESLIVGKSVYMLCQGQVATMTFQSDGNIAMMENGTMEYTPYSISGEIIYTTEEGAQQAHTVVEKSTSFIKIDEGNGSFTYFYFTEGAALAGTASDCGGEDGGGAPVAANDLVSGTVDFQNFPTPEGITTDNAWIRITPTVFANPESGYNGVQCEIAPDGSFGSNCVIFRDEAGVRDAFAAEGATFGYIVYRDSLTDCPGDTFDAGAPSVPLTLPYIESSLVITPVTYSAATPCP